MTDGPEHAMVIEPAGPAVAAPRQRRAKRAALMDPRRSPDTIADPSLSLAEKKRAYGLIVKHAALLDPDDAGFWRAGVALKVALCAWLDFQPMLKH